MILVAAVTDSRACWCVPVELAKTAGCTSAPATFQHVLSRQALVT